MSTNNSFYSNYRAPVPKPKQTTKDFITVKPEVRRTNVEITDPVFKQEPRLKKQIKKKDVKKSKFTIKKIN